VSLKPYQHHLRALDMRCRNQSPAQLRQYRLKFQNVSFQNISGPHVWRPLPDKPVSEHRCVLGASLGPPVGSYPLPKLFVGAWLQSDCQSDESILESNPETCLLLCLLHKEAIRGQCAFVCTAALLCFACVQRFHLRVLKCSMNSNDHV